VVNREAFTTCRYPGYLLARHRNGYFRVDRVNNGKRIVMCVTTGTNSFGGTTVIRLPGSTRRW